MPEPVAPAAAAHEASPGAPASHAPVYAAPKIDLSQHFPGWVQAEMAGNALWQFLAAVGFLRSASWRRKWPTSCCGGR